MDVVRDCAADGNLDDPHTEAEKRAALKQIPADIDEYSDCRSIIGAEIGHGRDVLPAARSQGSPKGRARGAHRRQKESAPRPESSDGARSRRRRARGGSGARRVAGELLADADRRATGARAATQPTASAGLAFADYAWAALATSGLLALGAVRELRLARHT